MASAQASGVRKLGTPASLSIASASGASGTRQAAIGFAAPALSTIGLTASSGWNRAEEPITGRIRSYSGAVVRMSSAAFITS